MKTKFSSFAGFLFALLLVSSQAFATDFDINGFGSIYYAQTFQEELLPYGFYDRFPNFSSFSSVGANLRAGVSNRMTLAAQILAAAPSQTTQSDESSTANTQWQLRAKWAFVDYDLTSSVNVKAGRQMLPVLFASEFSTVGFLMPYRQIPPQIQSTLPFSGFDGVSITYSQAVASDSELRLIGFVGTGNIDNGIAISGSEHNLIGLTSQWRSRSLQLHGSLYHEEANIIVQGATGASHASGNLEGSAVGYRYDSSHFVSWGEYSYRWNTDSDGTFLPSLRGAYALVGYRIGKFMPRYMYGWSDQTIIDQTTFSVKGTETTHTVGLNYQVDEHSVVKVECEFLHVPSGKDPSSAVRDNGSTKSDATSVFAGIDFIF